MMRLKMIGATPERRLGLLARTRQRLHRIDKDLHNGPETRDLSSRFCTDVLVLKVGGAAAIPGRPSPVGRVTAFLHAETPRKQVTTAAM